ncbi:MAG: STAS domain-containing protein [Candidatus Riflebacteria bacterium]|nr:STAS domain-containing protein [Candidatus Riflebacteria bacterium]
MKIESRVENAEKTKYFLLEGELDVHQTKELRFRLLDELEESEWKYVLEMKGVTYLDSSGLGMLVYLKKEIVKRGGTLLLISLKDSVLNVFKMTRLDSFFDISYDDK